MFPCLMSLLEVCMRCRLFLQACFNVTREDVVLGECCPSSRDSLNLLVLVFVLYLCPREM